jgi:hypothetical protein
MGFNGILFPRPVAAAHDADPPFFSDLNLDQVFAAMTAGRDEYRLAPFFRVPLHDPDDVAYRHEVFRDLENEAAAGAVTAFAAKMRTMRGQLEQARKLRHRYQQERWFLDAAATYRDAVRVFAGALSGVGLTSRALTGFRDYLAGYTGSAAFTGLDDDISRVAGTLEAVRYCVSVKGSRVTVSRYAGEPDYSAQVVATFAKFARGAVKDYHARFSSWPDMNHVEERVLDQVVRLFPGEFGALDSFAAEHADFAAETALSFDREIQFYLAYLDFVAPLKSAGLPFCYPDVSADDKRTDAEAAFDLALAARLVPRHAAVVTNDFGLSGPERIFVVTGPNHGGKTTFARMFGEIHYLASLGYPVPARRARLFLPDQVFTHFEREEDLTARHGRLEDELYRIRDVLRDATSSSLLVMNESFSSTTLGDARFIGERVLDTMTGRGMLGVYVTFVDELASRSHAVVSMVAGVVPDDPAERTFTVVRRPADGLAYAAAIAAKYGLTYRQLRQRLPVAGGGAA